MHKIYYFSFIFLLFACAKANYPTSDFTVISPTFYYVIGSSAPLYESATLDNPVVKDSVTQGERLLVVGHNQSGWFTVKRLGVTYYARESTLAIREPVVATPAPPATGSSGAYRSIQTGPRGGKYYINSNGNKTYIKRK